MQFLTIKAATSTRPQNRTGVKIIVNASLCTQGYIAPLINQAALFEWDGDSLDLEKFCVEVDDVLIQHLYLIGNSRRICQVHDRHLT